MRRIICACLFSICTSTYAGSQDSADLDALATADQVQPVAEKANDWHTYLEAAYAENAQRYGWPPYRMERLSADVAFDKTVASGWRVIFADRLDWDWQGESPNESKTNTLKELYGSWQAASNEIVDFGRINTRYGVASGYNPTDYFRNDAVRDAVSVDPNSLRNNRMGSVMLRTQYLWAGGGISAMLSPKLTNQATTDAFSPDFGATNHDNRYLIALSQQIVDNVNPQFLLYGERGKSTQFGFDLTHVIGDATVAYIEWSGGQGATQYAQAVDESLHSGFRNRTAAGFTYSTANKISLTLEAEYDGAAPDSDDWNALRDGPLPAYEQYRNYVQEASELATRKALFCYA
ncbi:MAG TPA: hypothetical protein VK832_14765, partial [Burkholderiaceae bacterium]|nr:hypothetical protein [Burkholderiaceae bacterium]